MSGKPGYFLKKLQQAGIAVDAFNAEFGDLGTIAYDSTDAPAQLVITPVTRANLVEVSTVSGTVRGDGGFGSTGTTPPKAKQTLKAAPKKKAVPAKKTPLKSRSRSKSGSKR